MGLCRLYVLTVIGTRAFQGNRELPKNVRLGSERKPYNDLDLLI